MVIMALSAACLRNSFTLALTLQSDNTLDATLMFANKAEDNSQMDFSVDFEAS